MISGHNYNEVLGLLQTRIRNGRGSSGGRKLGLVVEGGAMRGTYTGGALLGLHLLGAVNVFDRAYASSAGAINTAHFLSGVGHLKAATYYKALADGRFFNPKRIHCVVDIDFLFDVVLRTEIRLEIERLATSKTPLDVALLNCSTGAGEMKAVAWTSPQAWHLLKAAVAMPVVYNRKIKLKDGCYVDGGMAIPFPLTAAIKDGMTDIVLILSQNPRLPVESRGLLQRLLWSTIFAKGQSNLIRVFDQWEGNMRHLNRVACGHAVLMKDINILTIAPTVQKVRSSTMDRVLLRDSCIEMAHEVLTLFGASSDLVNPLIEAGHI